MMSFGGFEFGPITTFSGSWLIRIASPYAPHNSPTDSPPDSCADSPQTAPGQPALEFDLSLGFFSPMPKTLRFFDSDNRNVEFWGF